MAEQAQSDAGDLDGLHDGPQDASQDPTKPPTQEQYTRLIRELNEPDTPPKEDKVPPQLQPERAKLLQNLLNAIPIASADQIAQNATGLHAPKHPTRSDGPRQKPQPPSPKLQVPSANPRLGKHIRSYVRPAWTPPTSSNTEKVGG